MKLLAGLLIVAVLGLAQAGLRKQRGRFNLRRSFDEDEHYQGFDSSNRAFGYFLGGLFGGEVKAKEEERYHHMGGHPTNEIHHVIEKHEDYPANNMPFTGGRRHYRQNKCSGGCKHKYEPGFYSHNGRHSRHDFDSGNNMDWFEDEDYRSGHRDRYNEDNWGEDNWFKGGHDMNDNWFEDDKSMWEGDMNENWFEDSGEMWRDDMNDNWFEDDADMWGADMNEDWFQDSNDAWKDDYHFEEMNPYDEYDANIWDYEFENNDPYFDDFQDDMWGYEEQDPYSGDFNGGFQDDMWGYEGQDPYFEDFNSGFQDEMWDAGYGEQGNYYDEYDTNFQDEMWGQQGNEDYWNDYGQQNSGNYEQDFGNENVENDYWADIDVNAPQQNNEDYWANPGASQDSYNRAGQQGSYGEDYWANVPNDRAPQPNYEDYYEEVYTGEDNTNAYSYDEPLQQGFGETKIDNEELFGEPSVDEDEVNAPDPSNMNNFENLIEGRNQLAFFYGRQVNLNLNVINVIDTLIVRYSLSLFCVTTIQLHQTVIFPLCYYSFVHILQTPNQRILILLIIPCLAKNNFPCLIANIGTVSPFSFRSLHRPTKAFPCHPLNARKNVVTARFSILFPSVVFFQVFIVYCPVYNSMPVEIPTWTDLHTTHLLPSSAAFVKNGLFPCIFI
eukprot:TRINITY_DN4753_c0_g1_i6.p1 TRINITY_DN4753_c0_g1~~TRINITY_DN4753_c0_g1_i6.p1  ORF type:complete len:665 (-),score=56.19 TRINITY_DN4753_c0_g1_i6:2657-4651(-)